MTEGRILCLDVGDRRIGVAISDLLGLTAQPVETYTRRSEQEDVAHICELMQQRSAQALLLGLPRNMDGSEGLQAQKVRALGAALSEAGVTPHYFDERLSTRSAHAALIEGGMQRKKRKQVVDRLAAQLILQAYLDSLSSSGQNFQ